MFDDIKCEVVEPAKTPDGQREQPDCLPRWVVEEKQNAGNDANEQEQQSFQFDPARMHQVFHENKLKIAVAARSFAPGPPRDETTSASRFLI